MKRGDIYLANINPRSGSEQKGIRPVIIISHDSFNTTINWNSIIVIPLTTSQIQAKRSPTIVLLNMKNTGLDKDSVAICHQITTLDKSKLQQKIGTVRENDLQSIEQAIKNALCIL